MIKIVIEFDADNVNVNHDGIPSHEYIGILQCLLFHAQSQILVREMKPQAIEPTEPAQAEGR